MAFLGILMHLFKKIYNMAFLGILMHLFKKIYNQHVRNAVLDVCAKSVPVRGKSGEMRGLLRGEKLP